MQTQLAPQEPQQQYQQQQQPQPPPPPYPQQQQQAEITYEDANALVKELELLKPLQIKLQLEWRKVYKPLYWKFIESIGKHSSELKKVANPEEGSKGSPEYLSIECSDTPLQLKIKEGRYGYRIFFDSNDDVTDILCTECRRGTRYNGGRKLYNMMEQDQKIHYERITNFFREHTNIEI